jgi:hypothetical protein
LKVYGSFCFKVLRLFDSLETRQHKQKLAVK